MILSVWALSQKLLIKTQTAENQTLCPLESILVRRGQLWRLQSLASLLSYVVLSPIKNQLSKVAKQGNPTSYPNELISRHRGSPGGNRMRGLLGRRHPDGNGCPEGSGPWSQVNPTCYIMISRFYNLSAPNILCSALLFDLYESKLKNFLFCRNKCWPILVRGLRWYFWNK